MKTIKAAQDNGQTILVCDMGRAFDVMAAKDAGVDVGKLLISQPDNEAQLLEIAASVLRAGVCDMALFVGRVSPLAQTQIRIAATGTRTELVFA